MRTCLVALAIAAPIIARAQAIDADVARLAFAEIRQRSDADGGALWGRPLSGPVFFVDPGSREIAANQADPGGILKGDAGLFRGTLPAEFSPANTAIEFAGMRWTMVMWPLPENR